MNTVEISRDTDRAPSRGFQPLRDLPTVIWFVLVVVVCFVQSEVPAPRWLMIHLLLLGAATHAILVWSQHFSFALLRAAQTVAHQRWQTWRLALANLGAAAVMIGVVWQMLAATIAGAALLIIAVVWHGVSLVLRVRGALPGRFGRTIRYYIAAAAFLPLGAAVGAWLAHDASVSLALAHVLINMLGWIGLTVAGTLVTLWPTILRTRAAERSASGAAKALPVLSAGVAVAAVGAAGSWMLVLVLGLVGYVVGLIIIGVSLAKAALSKPPKRFAALSVGAAMLWWIGCLAVLIISGTSAWMHGHGVVAVRQAVDGVVPYLAAGFVAQVLVGALSHLVPVVLGGGPHPVKAGAAVFDVGGVLRVTVANAALLLCTLPVSNVVRMAAAVVYLVSIGSFLPILFVSMRAQRRAKAEGPRTP